MVPSGSTTVPTIARNPPLTYRDDTFEGKIATFATGGSPIALIIETVWLTDVPKAPVLWF